MYRTICCELWTDDKVQSLPPFSKLLFLYLITNPHSHMSGIYYLPRVLMEHEVGLGRGIDGAWKGLLDSRLVEEYRPLSQVWVVNMLPYQAKGNKSEKGVASHLSTLHSSPLLERFLVKYPHITQWLSPDFIRCPIDTPSNPHTKVPVPVPDSSLSSLQSESEEGKECEKGEFDRLWESFPKKVGKKAAQKAFQNARDRPNIDDLIASIQRQALSPQWTKDGGQFIPHLATWLNQGRWDDEPVIPTGPNDPNGFLDGFKAFLER